MQPKDFVTHIGGTFIYSNNPKSLAGWYNKHLGIEFEAHSGDTNIYYKSFYYNEIPSGGLSLRIKIDHIFMKRLFVLIIVLMTLNLPRVI
ncbi:MAG: hypothetical protein NTU73_12015 [Ignavibacteriae bacterium]|nr:hypothetical protein [Ignavibacteriota bacterium]